MKKIVSIAAVAALTFNMTSVPFNVLAEQLPAQNEVNATNVIERAVTPANVSKFSLNGQDVLSAYNEVFKMDNANIEAIDNNGGKFESSALTYAIDDNLTTHWETGKPNSETFTNEVVFTFKDVTELERIVYAPRVSGTSGKGFPQTFEIYAAEEGTDDYTLVTTGEYKGSASDVIEIQFEPTSFKQLKFVFTKANQNWAAASEFMFYKKDDVRDSMNNLFSDSTLNQVRDEFNNLEAITALAKNVEIHPLYDLFKENIENAKSLVNRAKIEPTIAKVSPLTAYGTAVETAYNDVFQMPNTNVKNIMTNAGSYPGTKLDFMLDNNPNTHWETTKNNSATFTNELVFEFEQAEVLERIGFLARSINQKGFPEQFEIYASETSVGDTFQLVASGSAVKTGDFVQFAFEPTNFKRLKFVFTKANIDRPFAAEFRFYKEDPIQNTMNELFADSTMSAVTTSFNTIDKINALEEKAKAHPLYEAYKESLELAKKIVKGELVTAGRTIVAEQHGNMVNHAQQKLKMPYGNNNQPTGIAAKAGEKITVYVEADASGPLPQLVFSQQEGSWNAWARSVNLKPGKNEFTVPVVYTGNVTQGGPLYIVNPYTPEQQAKTPIIRIEGGERFPMFTKDTDVAEFKALLTDYNERLNADKAAHPNVGDRELIDVVEIVSDRIVFTGTASEAYNQYITKQLDPMATVNGYDVWIDQIFDFTGFDKTSEVHNPKYIRENIRLMQPYGAMYAAGNHTGIQRGTVPFMFSDFSITYPGWGLTHEIGHRMAVGVREYGEVTNNMVSMAMSVAYQSIDNRIPFEKMYSYLIAENNSVMSALSLQERLGAFWQLELAHPGYWAQFNKYYREKAVSLTNGDISKQQYIIEFSSDTLKQNLSGYFARHGFTVTDETKQAVSKYPAPKNIWYLNNSVIGYEGNGFTTDASVNVSVSHNESKQTNTLTFAVDAGNKEHLLGYEILRNGTIIGFTSTSTFVDQHVDPTENYRYEVIAYDKTLNNLQPADAMAFTPTIVTENQLTLKLNQAFDANMLVKAFDYQGNDITQDVTLTSNVDVTKKGNYELVYTVENNGVTETKKMPVTVVSDYDYISDITPVVAKIAWGSYKVDKSPTDAPIRLVRQGHETTYTKGIGTHANSEVVYNLEDKGFNFFESYIGIDQALKGNNNASATFEIWVDGVNLFKSGVFRSATDSKFVKIPVTGAKELKLITTDAGNGNGADHTVWADAKLTKNSSAPIITVTSEATKIGQPIDILGHYSATDAEDGDLTAQVEVLGVENVNFNEVGNYELNYTVTDSDGNRVTAIRTIAVVNMEHYHYLSDFDWKSTQNSYRTALKDIASSGNSLRLTREDGSEIVYEKGIGAHANSTIVYDLTDKDGSYFTTFVGVDRRMYNTVGSVVFQIYVDGIKQFDSGLMTSKMPQQFVEINIAGAKELTLIVTDGGNGNGSDHATWGDSKLHYVKAE